MKKCMNCNQEFNWMDYGSTEKFDKSNICPSCEYDDKIEQDRYFEWQESKDRGEIF